MRERIKQLAEQFLQRCLRDLAFSRELVTRLRTGDAHAFKELEHLAHRMCGTGASLGFESVSADAATIERLAEAQPGNTIPDRKTTELLSEYIARLEQDIGRLVEAAAIRL
jgi:HPt (histidine-containing phosphotransfer) domain-containing protein